MGTNLYVGNVSFNTIEADLQSLFAQAGNVVRCSVVTDRETGRSRGFAFVEMSTDAEAQTAISQLNGKELDGRPLKVNEAKPREDRPPRRFNDDGAPRAGGHGDRDRRGPRNSRDRE